jgi:glutamate carboxypeptidase
MALPITTGNVDRAAFLEELRLWVEMETPSYPRFRD